MPASQAGFGSLTPSASHVHPPQLAAKTRHSLAALQGGAPAASDPASSGGPHRQHLVAFWTSAGQPCASVTVSNHTSHVATLGQSLADAAQPPPPAQLHGAPSVIGQQTPVRGIGPPSVAVSVVARVPPQVTRTASDMVTLTLIATIVDGDASRPSPFRVQVPGSSRTDPTRQEGASSAEPMRTRGPSSTSRVSDRRSSI